MGDQELLTTDLEKILTDNSENLLLKYNVCLLMLTDV